MKLLEDKDGQDNALSACQDIVRGLHDDLWPLADKVLKIGVRVKSASAAIRALRLDCMHRFREERRTAGEKLLAMTSPDDNGDYRTGTIQAAFEEYREALQKHGDVEGVVARSREAKEYNRLLEGEYAEALVDLDERARLLGQERVPWEIRYFATSDLDGDTGKLMVTTPFDSSQRISDFDVCSLCGMVLPSGETRIRCFECSPDCDRAVTCAGCDSIARRVHENITARIHGSSRWEAARRELRSCSPHLTHLSAKEDDTLWAIRSRALLNGKRPSDRRSEAQPESIRRMLPRLFLDAYPNRPCFGVPRLNDSPERCRETAPRELALESISYYWFTYERVWGTASLLARGMLELLPPPPRSGTVPRPEIGIISSPGPVFCAVELACVALGRVSASTDTTWRLRDALNALSQARVSTLVLDPCGFRLMKREGAAPPTSVRNVIVIATDPFELEPSPGVGDIAIENISTWGVGPRPAVNVIFSNRLSWLDGVKISDAVKLLEDHITSKDDLPGDSHIFGIFSSGTSGSGGHKGVMIRQESFRKQHASSSHAHPLVAPLIYSPTWSTGKDIVWGSLCVGGRVGFAVPRQKGSSVWRYLHSIKPTWCLSLVPALVSDLLEDHSNALAWELSRRENTNMGPAELQRFEARAHARAAKFLYLCLGGVVDSISIGSAMVNQSHAESLTRLLPCGVLQGYGSTEGGGLALASHGTDQLAPLPSYQFRIESRPELGYTEDDLPFPRGELLILGESTAAPDEWFGDQEARYAEDGYYRTGDIVEFNKEKNTFRIVDRVSSLVKLADGKFFSPSRVESAIGDLRELGATDHIVAVAPNGAIAVVLETSLATRVGIEASKVLGEVRKRCCRAGIDQRSIPQLVVADLTPGLQAGQDPKCKHLWEATGCYTVSGKLVRRRVLNRVASQLASICLELDKAAQSKESELLADNDVETTATTLLQFMDLASDCDDEVTSLINAPLATLGIDSLRWSRLRSKVRQLLARCGHLIIIPYFDPEQKSIRDVSSWMKDILQDGNNLQRPKIRAKKSVDDLRADGLVAESSSAGDRAENIHLEQAEGAKRWQKVLRRHFKSLNSLEADLVRRVDDIEKIFDAPVLPKANPSGCNPKVILLTGATGYLGRHILTTLLERRDEVLEQANESLREDIKIICLVRGTSLIEACQRLIGQLSKCSERIFNAESFLGDSTTVSKPVGGLQVVLADVSAPCFGLQRHDYDNVAIQVEVIIHCAASVKMWPLGDDDGDAHDMVIMNTSSCISVAQMSARSKILRCGIPASILYISTKSVESEGLQEGQIVERVGEAIDTWTLRRQPYSTSKLLGETVLLHANRMFGFSLSIMRPSFLTFSSGGDANDSDYVVRLLLSVSSTCISPTGGNSEFLNRQMSFCPVDAYASKVAKESFSMFNTRDAKLGIARRWPDSAEEGEKFSIRDILCNIESQAKVSTYDGAVESVAPFAFRAAVIAARRPLPFLPLVDWLVREEDKDGARSPVSSFLFSKSSRTRPPASLPPSLRRGLAEFLRVRCSHLSLVPELVGERPC